MKTSEALRRAKAKIGTPEKWRQGAAPPGRNVKMCLGEALESEGGLGAMDAFRHATGILNITAWNDDPRRTHAEVIETLDQVIEEEESKEVFLDA